MDLLIRAGILVAGNPPRRVLRAGVAIADGRIVGIGDPTRLIRAHGAPRRTLDAADKVVIPGLVNGHTHLFQSAIRTLGHGLSLADWQARITRPFYMALTADDAAWFTLLGALENIRSGVTTVLNFQAWPRDADAFRLQVEAVARSGLRGALVKSNYLRAAPTDLLSDGATALMEASQALEAHHGSHGGRISVWLGAPLPQHADVGWWHAAAILARDAGPLCGLHTHVAETAHAARAAHASLGRSEASFLASAGALDVRFVAAHAVALTGRAIRVLADRRAHVAHCPVSNMYLASGVAPLTTLREAGVNVALGTDGAASNGSQNLFETMKCAVLLQSVVMGRPGVISAADALAMATTCGARALGLELYGIVEGAPADLVVLDLAAPGTSPPIDVLAAIVFSAGPASVESVVIAGRVVLESGRFTQIDERTVVEEAARRARRVLAAGASRVCAMQDAP